jgi:cupin superfamily acireductone dioxygenase involved in methionine salvage
MKLIEIVIITASIITSSTVIITAFVTAYRLIRKWDKWVKQKDKHDIEQYVQILRLVIMTPEMPLSERISAGDTYVNELHRNGAVKQKYNELLQKFKNEHLEG